MSENSDLVNILIWQHPLEVIKLYFYYLWKNLWKKDVEDLMGLVVGELGSVIFSGTSNGLFSWPCGILLELMLGLTSVLEMIGPGGGGACSLLWLFNLFGEVHCFLGFPVSPVSLNNELPLGEDCILDNETEGDWSLVITGVSANFFPRAL